VFVEYKHSDSKKEGGGAFKWSLKRGIQSMKVQENEDTVEKTESVTKSKEKLIE
jgi:hypothetical protein